MFTHGPPCVVLPSPPPPPLGNKLYLFVIALSRGPVSLISDDGCAPGSKINGRHEDDKQRKSENVEYLTSKLRMNLTTFSRARCLPTASLPIFRPTRQLSTATSNTG